MTFTKQDQRESVQCFFLDYAAQYVDKCNLEYLKTIPEKRKDKLRNIAKRFIKQPVSYKKLKSEFEYSAKQHNCSMHELYDPKMEYPEEILWQRFRGAIATLCCLEGNQKHGNKHRKTCKATIYILQGSFQQHAVCAFVSHRG